jgi:hypothetical protein
MGGLNMPHAIHKVPWVAAAALLTVTAFTAVTATGADRQPKTQPLHSGGRGAVSLSEISRGDIESLFDNGDALLRLRAIVEQVNGAFRDYIKDVSEEEFERVAPILGMNPDVADVFYQRAADGSTFRAQNRGQNPTLAWHEVAPTLLALRLNSTVLDHALGAVTDRELEAILASHEGDFRKIIGALPHLSRVFFSIAVLPDAIRVFGGNVSAKRVGWLAEKYGFAASAAGVQLARADFMMGMWLMLLANAP